MTEQEDQFRVVFEGSLTGDYSLEKTKLRFGKGFGLSTEKINRYFSGKAITLKSNLTEDGAMDYAVKLAEIGCETYIESVNQGIGYEEERRVTTRRIRFRRGPRPGAIVPDRRRTPSRRKEDLIALEKYGDFPGNSVEE